MVSTIYLIYSIDAYILEHEYCYILLMHTFQNVNIVGRSKIARLTRNLIQRNNALRWYITMVPGKRKEKREKLGLGDDARSLYSSAAKAKL